MFNENFSYHIAKKVEETPALYVIVSPEASLNHKLFKEIQFFKASNIPIEFFPDWEILPYDHFSPHQEIISARIKILSKLSNFQHGILFISMQSLMQKLMPVSFIKAHAFDLKPKDKIHRDALKTRLIQSGYRAVKEVMERGEFAVRGSIFDLFPMGSDFPYRIDCFDDEIESIKTFDPDTQRSITAVDAIDLLPAKEFPLDDDAIDRFREQWRLNFEGNPSECPLYQAVSQGGVLPGIEYYFPLFFEETSTFFDYLPNNTVFLKVNQLNDSAENYYKEIKSRYESLRYNRVRPILAPEKLFLNPTEVFTVIKSNYTSQNATLSYSAHPNIAIDHKASDPFAHLKTFIFSTLEKKSRLLFCAESIGRREALSSLFSKANIEMEVQVFKDWQDFLLTSATLGLVISPIENLMVLEGITLVPESVVLGEQVLQGGGYSYTKRKSDQEKIDHAIKNLNELNIGAPVVHNEHGVGRYQGLQVLDINQIEQEFLVLEYANSDKLYVPVSNLDVISRYSGLDAENAPLHKLGSDQFEKAKKKAAEQVCDVAAELLEIHAKRQIRPGIAHEIDAQYALFANAFPFEETPDQLHAIDNVIKDMQSDKSMDRLICGDVGFGKTEVAMRAAYIAVQNGFQVCVLVPTTLLAQQHYQNFLDRFADYPFKIEMISRFRSAGEQSKILSGLKSGAIDIIIGTHKLLNPDCVFKKLGLVVIDEEHRFGVRQKEKLKALRSEVDILTLTATPIPRTLNLSMAGMRDLSIISTPPLKRLSIKTFVHSYESSLIREAILREILRGGQVYYLYNDVETMPNAFEKLCKIVPEAKIACAHGQMSERNLEKVMREFYHQHYNVLMCTTIIETGIDIPSANTIIIERADKFGLAQLHQLRGRVGRSHHQAYAYLLTPLDAKLSKDAEKRLDAITQLEDLGAGFALATHDLEIRGAGEILGDNQSGNMHEIGFSLYMDLLNRAVKTLSQISKTTPDDLLKPHPDEGEMVEIDLLIPALIPESYVPDAHVRLVLYKRIAHCKLQDSLDDLKIEMIDRFGILPIQTKRLFEIAELKVTAEKLKIKKIQAGQKSVTIEFYPTHSIDPLKIIHLIQKFPQSFKLEGENKLRLLNMPSEFDERIQFIEKFFGRIQD